MMVYLDRGEETRTHALRILTTIEDLKHNLAVIEENLKALAAYEHRCSPAATAQPLSIRNLQERRDNLTATIAILQRRLDAE